MAESIFVLSRVTTNPQDASAYREVAWSVVQAIHGSRHLRGKMGGFSSWSLDPVTGAPTGDLQPDTFIGATLKYLYLALEDEKKPEARWAPYLSLSKWVFNAVGQPLPVCGTHRLYGKC